VWQLVQEIFPDQQIGKTHPDAWEYEDGLVSIITIRNPYDVAASRYRIRLSRGGEGVDGMIGLEAELDVMSTMYVGLKYVVCSPHMLLRYETFYSNYDWIFDLLEIHFDLDIHENVRNHLKEKYSLAANKARAEKLKNFNEIDDMQIHGDHIGPVHPNTWQESLPKWGHEMVRKYCEPIAKEWRYEIC